MNTHDLIAAASKAQTSGRLGEAESLITRALRSSPDDREALLLAGIIGVQQNNPATALPPLSKLLELEPGSYDAPFWLSMIMRKHGRRIDALDMARRAVTQDARNEYALNQLGLCCLDLNLREEAVTAFGQACSLVPNGTQFFENLGRALQSLSRTEDAVAAYQRALGIGPLRIPCLYQLGDCYMVLLNAPAAAGCAQAILKINPQSVHGNLLLAQALIADGDVAQGATYALKTMELAPGNAVPVAYYGRALQSLGKISEAEEQFKRSIELEPQQGFGYFSLVHNHKVTEAERPLVEVMRQVAKNPDLPPQEHIQLQYGLGKVLEDLGEYQEAISHFDEANRLDHELKEGVAPFDRDQLKATADFIIKTFTRKFFAQHNEAGLSGPDGDLPIFVVGMMRSGTTLAEQIISSHPDVGGAGEQIFWPSRAGSGERMFDFSLEAQPLNSPLLLSLAKEYIVLLKKIAPGNRRVVDKMNTNYLLLGLLHLAFPEARIVHMCRHPVDTCISIWATPVAIGIDLCASRENIVFAYEQYLRIMAHYRQVLPSNRLLDVQYEELVSNQEKLTRQMVEFCGLPWDEACMRPESNERSVKTPSVWQVRQPVYKTSTARWRKYEPWLGAFASLFEYSPEGSTQRPISPSQ